MVPSCTLIDNLYDNFSATWMWRRGKNQNDIDAFTGIVYIQKHLLALWDYQNYTLYMSRDLMKFRLSLYHYWYMLLSKDRWSP